MDARHRQSPSLGERLLMARKAKGWSTRAVAERVAPLAKVSHATVSNYEKNATKPPIDVLSALATLYERPINWFLGDGPMLSGVRYRNLKSKVGVRDRHRFEGESQRWLDAYVALERHLGDVLRAEVTFEVQPKETPAEAAARFRKEVAKLDDDEPVHSVVEQMERLGVRVMEMETDLAIDGMAAAMGEEHVVVLNAHVSNDRARMNAAHELGHVVHGDCGPGAETKKQEDAAFAFASHLMLTSAMLKEAFRRKSMVDLVKFKERFGISLAAMVYRGNKDGLLSDREAKRLWIEFNRRGWRKEEPGRVLADRATRFESLLGSAIIERNLALGALGAIVGVREDELRRRLDLATGSHDDVAEEEEVPTRVQRLRLVRE